MACVEECISERESRKFEEGLNTKVKLDMFKRFGKIVEFKKYLHGICDAGSRLFRGGDTGGAGGAQASPKFLLRELGTPKINAPCFKLNARPGKLVYIHTTK